MRTMFLENCIHRPEYLSRQFLQPVANSLKHNSTLQELKIAGKFSYFDENCYMIKQSIEEVKWKVKAMSKSEDEYIRVTIDFKQQC